MKEFKQISFLKESTADKRNDWDQEKLDRRKKASEKYDLINESSINESLSQKLLDLGIEKKKVIEVLNKRISESKEKKEPVYISKFTPYSIVGTEMQKEIKFLAEDEITELCHIINRIFINNGFVLEEDARIEEKRTEKNKPETKKGVGIERSLPQGDKD